MHFDQLMRAGELCIRDVVTALPDESVVDAAKRMAELGVGDLLVVDETGGITRPIGIITDRDLVVFVLARVERSSAQRIKISDVMRSELITATEDEDIESVLAKLRQHTIRRLPIVDERGGLQGIVSIDDVLEWMTEQMRAATALLERQGRRPDELHAR